MVLGTFAQEPSASFLPFWCNPARGSHHHCPIAVFHRQKLAVARLPTAIRHPMLVGSVATALLCPDVLPLFRLAYPSRAGVDLHRWAIWLFPIISMGACGIEGPWRRNVSPPGWWTLPIAAGSEIDSAELRHLVQLETAAQIRRKPGFTDMESGARTDPSSDPAVAPVALSTFHLHWRESRFIR